MPTARVDEALRIEALTLDVLHRDLDAILAIDRETSPETLEPWSREQFFFDLPGKWRYSMLASNAAGVAGFQIVSIKQDVLHVHRTVVGRHLRHRGAGTLLVASLARLGRRDGYRQMTTKVASCSERGCAAQLRMGARLDRTEGPNAFFVYDLDVLIARLRKVPA